jgi:hypothetical protein
MVEYTCGKCGKIFNKKYPYDIHINRQKPCSRENSSKCDCCDKTFTREDNLKIHKETSCKGKKNEILVLKEKLEETSNELKKLKEQLLNPSNSISNIASNNNTDQSTTVTTTSSHNNTSSNNTNSHNTVNTQNIVINFGQENINKLTGKEKSEILESSLYSIIKCAEKVHFNPRLPQQHNVYSTNIRSKHAYKYLDSKYVLTNQKELIDDIIENRKEDVRLLLTKYGMQIRAIYCEKIKGLLERMDNHDENEMKRARDAIAYLLFNNRDLII